MSDNLTQVSYADSLFADSFIVAGVKLKPFCLGHILLLESLKNPLIAPDEEQVPMDDAIAHFFLAAIVCSLTYEDAVEMLNDTKLFTNICKLFVANLEKNMEIDKDWNIFSQVALFKTYMSAHLDSMPKYDEVYEDKNSIQSGSDWRAAIFITFKKLGYSQNEILNMSVKRLFAEWVQYAESEGSIKIQNKFQVTMLKDALKR